MAAKKRSSKEGVVIDCSVTLSWFFEDESGAYGNTVQEAMIHRGTKGVVPALWQSEVANTLVVGERRKRTTEAKAHRFLSLLALLPIQVEGAVTAESWANILRIAREQALSAYDAAYLELAERRGLPLATLDDRLRSAALAVGIAVFGLK